MKTSRSYKCIVIVGTRLEGGRSGVWFLAGTSFLHNVQTSCGGLPFSVCQGFFPWDKETGAWRWSLVPRLRMRWAIPSLLSNAFMAWTGATLPSPFKITQCRNRGFWWFTVHTLDVTVTNKGSFVPGTVHQPKKNFIIITADKWVKLQNWIYIILLHL